MIAGGGTAGHVIPGVSIAREMVARGAPPEAVHYVGSERGIEKSLVPEAGITLTVLPGRGIQRRLTLANIGAAFGLLRAMVSGFRLVRRRRPAVVVGLGGYASVPCGVAAVLQRVPLVLAEQNARAGAANRLLSRFAKASAVSFDGTNLRRAVFTGNPVRPEVLAVDREAQRAAARSALGVDDDRVLIAVFGGSLGARRINESVLVACALWRDRDDLHVRHISGRRDYAVVSERQTIDDLDLLSYDLIEYEEDMPAVYAGADLVLCRAGATSVTEIAAVGIPSILVPLPNSPGDHQAANARVLADAGAAVLVADGDLDGERLAREVDALSVDPELRQQMADAARTIGRRDATSAVVDLIETHARRAMPGAREAA